MKTKPMVAGLALAALFFAILLPPEAYPDGKLAVILCATFAFFASLSERRIPPAYLYGGVLGFGFLFAHAFLISVDPYRSLEFTSVLWAYYCLFGFFLYAGFEPFKSVAICMVLLCLIVSGYGLYQYFWGFDQLYNYIFYAASDQVVKVPALERVATKRVFSTLALPGTLWGFLVIALPFHVALWKEQWKKPQLVRLAIVISAVMLFATGFLTRSFGFLLGLFTLAAAWLIIRRRRMEPNRAKLSINWARMTALLVVLAIAGGTFYSARRGVIEAANPFALRFKNWISAWTIFAANPMGTGLNTYGVVYSRYMLPDSNETQYAHNTPLQLLSELGFPVLIAAAALLLLALRAQRRGEFRSLSFYLLLALSVWVVHNLIDIDVYFPSVGVLGILLAGVLLRRPSVPAQPYPLTARLALAFTVAAGLSLLAFSALVMVSSELQFRAKAEFEENKLQAAADTLEQAKSLMPLNSSLFHDSGDVNLNLYHKRRDVRYLQVATESFRRAVDLSPAKAGSHTGLSLCLASANKVDEAQKEIRTAERLYPDNTYIHSISRLLEQRNAGIPFK
jgi:tetratricopeptide (TPR) repeat protein